LLHFAKSRVCVVSISAENVNFDAKTRINTRHDVICDLIRFESGTAFSVFCFYSPVLARAV